MIIERPTTKITLNNGEDGLSFIQPNGNVTDSVSYKKAPRGESYNRIENDWVWSAVLTPGSTNILPLSTGQSENSQKETEGNQFETQQLATVSEQIPKTKTPFPVFLTALSFALLSGTIIIFLKKKLI